MFLFLWRVRLQFSAEALIRRLQKIVKSLLKCLLKLFFSYYFLNLNDFDSKTVYEKSEH